MFLVIKLTSFHPISIMYRHVNVYVVENILEDATVLVKFKLCFEVIKEKGSECARIVTLWMNFQLVSFERYSFIC
jgi:hypothetical protein